MPNAVAGIYKQSVRGKPPKNKKEHQSTFFPDDATVDEIMDAITSVYRVSEKSSSVRYPPKLKGMTLQTIGDTVFPAGGKNVGPE